MGDPLDQSWAAAGRAESPGVTTDRIVVPAELAGFHAKYDGADGKAWSAALPEPTASYFGRWELRLDGPLRHGMVGLIVPVR